MVLPFGRQKQRLAATRMQKRVRNRIKCRKLTKCQQGSACSLKCTDISVFSAIKRHLSHSSQMIMKCKKGCLKSSKSEKKPLQKLSKYSLTNHCSNVNLWSVDALEDSRAYYQIELSGRGSQLAGQAQGFHASRTRFLKFAPHPSIHHPTYKKAYLFPPIHPSILSSVAIICLLYIIISLFY